MKLILQIKGSPTSGWYSPPKGTHSGERHREVGSGKAGGWRGKIAVPPKAVAEQVAKEPDRSAHIVDKASEISGGKMGKGYFIREDGKLVDISDDFGGGTNDHVGYVVASDDPGALGLDEGIADTFLRLNAELYGTDAREGLSWDDPRYEELDSEWMDAYTDLWTDIFDAGNVRIREHGQLGGTYRGKRVIAIDGLGESRANIGQLQDWVLGGQITSDKAAVYVWDSDRGSYSFTWSDLMAAKYPRDLKDMEGMFLRIILKGSPTSGWYSPPKGTHSGERHREVGSGKVRLAKKRVKLSPMGQEVAKKRLREIIYSIAKDGSVVEASDSAITTLSKMMANHDERVLDNIDAIHTCEDMKSFSAACRKYDELFPEVSIKTGNTNAFIVAGDISLGGGPKNNIVIPTFDPSRLSLFNHEIGHAWYYGLGDSARTSWNDRFHTSRRQPYRLPRDDYRANEQFANSYSAWIHWKGKPLAYQKHMAGDFEMIERLLEG